MLARLFRRQKDLCPEELVRPYCRKAREALLINDLARAVAYLERGIHVAPDQLDLYLQRAQIFQYGMGDCTRALRDYRHIQRILETQPDQRLAAECRKGIRDMMDSTEPVDM
ncbi:MAG: hypothetical protein QNK37_20825 [Acidobacteriota bacterium]|nr:hypothetical protein [Acidobacteriota bacterium]